jgi:membrane protein DedA with SNARE-associated domain
LDLADRWFAKYGEIIVFVSRLLPAIRTFIAFPAGVARMNVPRFIIYTFAGSLPWCIGLAYVGQKLGEHWDKDPRLKTLFHRFDFVIGIVIVLAAAWWIWRHLQHSKKDMQSAKSQG